MRTDLVPPKSFDHASVEMTGILARFITVAGLDLSFCVQHRPELTRDLSIEFSGPDVAMLLADRGELLEAIGVLATSVCGEEIDGLLPSAIRISSGGGEPRPGFAVPGERGRLRSNGTLSSNGTKGRRTSKAGHARGD